MAKIEKEASRGLPKGARSRGRAVGWTISVGFLATMLCFPFLQPGLAPARSLGRAAPCSLPALLAWSPQQLADLPIGRVNLLCAHGLRGSSRAGTEQSLAILEAWVSRVKSETERHLYRFRQIPSQYDNSEGFFRILMLVVVLAEDFGVHYTEQRKSGPATSNPDDGFFANASDVFLHGLLGPQRQGTCSSMPVLYVAVGRQLGYPLKLVTSEGHLFVRWEGTGERFNIEATGHGVNRFPDEYYRHWPFEITPQEEAAEGYLKSLTPPEELAVFLSIRGLCLRDNGRIAEAADAFAAAVRLAPNCRSYQQMLASLSRTLHRQVAVAPPPPQNR